MSDGATAIAWLEGNLASRTPGAEFRTDRETMKGIVAYVRHVERERDEALSEAKGWRKLFYKCSAELERCVPAQDEIDATWDAIGARGNRKHLTLLEQVSSLIREIDAAEHERDEARAALAKAPIASMFHTTSGFDDNGFLATYDAWKEQARALIEKGRQP